MAKDIWSAPARRRFGPRRRDAAVVAGLKRSAAVPQQTILDMLTHIVIWKYRADVEQEVREEHVAMLRGLASVITEIESLQVGFDVLGLPRSYDSGLVATFQNHAGLEAYTVHPEHIKAAEFGRSVSAHVASVDFESPQS